MSEHLGPVDVEGNRLEVLTSSAAQLAAYLKDIDAATTSIDLESYIYAEGFDRIGHRIAGAEFIGIDEGAAKPEGADGKRMLLQEVDRLVFAVILELVVPGRHRGDASGAVVQDVILEGPVPGGHLADGQPVETEVDRPREGNGRGRDNRPGI